MPLVNCAFCKKYFHAKPSWLKRGWSKYCSRRCLNSGQKKGKEFPCLTCGKLTYKIPRDIRRSKNKIYFCTKRCNTLWRNKLYVGEKHGNWIDGQNAYRNILERHDPTKKCNRCHLTDKRVLIVHHLDKNRTNNNVSNLVWLCCNCHFLIHHEKTEEEKFIKKLRNGAHGVMVNT